MSKALKSKIMLVVAMTIFGSVGIVVKYIQLPATYVAFGRGFIGMIFLSILCLTKKQKIFHGLSKKSWGLLILSGIAMGANWSLLFASYDYTSVATATLCYYLAPMFVILASPLILKEKLSIKKLFCAIAALVGMVFVSGIIENGFVSITEMLGVILSTIAALLYATVIIVNKKITEVQTFPRLVIQFGVSSLVLLPYSLISSPISMVTFDSKSLILLAILGVLHTGFTYALYFGSMPNLDAQTIAIFSYIDAVVAVLLSALWLKEPLSTFGIIGAVLIIGSAILCEIEFGKKRAKKKSEGTQNG